MRCSTLARVAAALMLAAGSTAALAQVGAAFTYQGQLKNSGANVNTPADMQFSLWTAASGGSQVGSTITQTGVGVSQGLFTTSVDFGVNPYIFGDALWLQVAVRNPAGSGSYVPMATRQRLSATPYSVSTRGVIVDPNGFASVRAISADPPSGARFYTTNLPPAANAQLVSVTVGNNAGPQTRFQTSATSPTFVDIGQIDSGSFVIEASDVPFLVMPPSGNIGMGFNNLNPTEALDVAGNIKIRSDDRFYFGLPAEGTDSIFFQRSNATPNNSTLRLIIGDDAAGSFDTFDICRDPNITVFSFQSNGNAFKPGGGSWAALCDERSKDNIQPLSGTLDRLLKLKGHSYTYKPEFVDAGRALPGTQVGLVAQEVEAIFPDWVSTSQDGMKVVTERATTALMVEAMRDLRSEKDAEINALKARLERLEALLAAQAAK